MSASIVVPFNPDDAERSRNWEWLKGRLATFHPTLEVIETGDSSSLWCKAKAVAAGVERASHDRLVMMDADVFVDPAALTHALDSVTDDRWVVPHDRVLRLTDACSRNVIANAPVSEQPKLCCKNLARHAYQGIAGGGLVVLTRTAWEKAPLDPRFEGWYGEDVAWSKALDTLVGPRLRLGANLFHLWHPSQPDRGQQDRNRPLLNRYRRAALNPTAMRRLIEEGRCAPSSDG